MSGDWLFVLGGVSLVVVYVLQRFIIVNQQGRDQGWWS